MTTAKLSSPDGARCTNGTRITNKGYDAFSFSFTGGSFIRIRCATVQFRRSVLGSTLAIYTVPSPTSGICSVKIDDEPATFFNTNAGYIDGFCFVGVSFSRDNLTEASHTVTMKLETQGTGKTDDMTLEFSGLV